MMARLLATLVVLVTITVFSHSAHACACCDTYQVVDVANWDVLNVRAGPGTDYQIVGVLQPGETCIFKTGQQSGNWVYVEWGGVEGWVNERFLAFYPGPRSDPGPGSLGQGQNNSPARCNELKRLCYSQGSNWGCNELNNSNCP